MTKGHLTLLTRTIYDALQEYAVITTESKNALSCG